MTLDELPNKAWLEAAPFFSGTNALYCDVQVYDTGQIAIWGAALDGDTREYLPEASVPIRGVRMYRPTPDDRIGRMITELRFNEHSPVERLRAIAIDFGLEPKTHWEKWRLVVKIENAILRHKRARGMYCED